jgi:hypothetical protein
MRHATTAAASKPALKNDVRVTELVGAARWSECRSARSGSNSICVPVAATDDGGSSGKLRRARRDTVGDRARAERSSALFTTIRGVGHRLRRRGIPSRGDRRLRVFEYLRNSVDVAGR